MSGDFLVALRCNNLETLSFFMGCEGAVRGGVGWGCRCIDHGDGNYLPTVGTCDHFSGLSDNV